MSYSSNSNSNSGSGSGGGTGVGKGGGIATCCDDGDRDGADGGDLDAVPRQGNACGGGGGDGDSSCASVPDAAPGVVPVVAMAGPLRPVDGETVRRLYGIPRRAVAPVADVVANEPRHGGQGRGGMKRVLAPMVRAGTLPLRLLSMWHGADAVYTEELIDHKLLTTQRVVSGSGFVDHVLAKSPETVVLRTCTLERSRVVLQIGTADAARAVRVGLMMERDVAAIDINMGCPKSFSVSGGMGAALLRTPELAEDILKSLRRNVSVPVSCKIRLLGDERSTVELMRRLEAAGAVAIAVHLRETHHRPSEPALWDRLRPLVDAVQVPVLANGDCYSAKDLAALQDKADGGIAGVLFARGALKNASVFRARRCAADAPVRLFDVMRDYAKLAHAVGNVLNNTVYTLHQMLHYNNDAATRAQPWAQALKQPKLQYPDLMRALDLPLRDEGHAMTGDGPVTWARLGMQDPSDREDGDDDDHDDDDDDERPTKRAKAR